MIITRTPFRVSFFGGGTDYPTWYREHGGAVLATTIDKYCYLACRFLPPFFEDKYRIVYSRTELTKTVDAIQHPSVRACLEFKGFAKAGTEIVHYADLPARTGLGSSSSFTVGLLSALSGLKGQMPSKRQLAEEAIHLEQTVMAENVGSQDQISAAFGGLNLVKFDNKGFDVKPVTTSQERIRELESSLMLVFTGISRLSSDIAAHQIRNIGSKAAELHEMRRMVDSALEILVSRGELSDFGRLLHESWMLKASLSDRISNTLIDDVYARARAHGALGGKLLGAGGGGFLLFFVEPSARAAVAAALSGFLVVPFRFEQQGSQVIFYEPQSEA